ncbi:hypothetical protein L596_002404 [Steinernema carpocapsae]|uniref:Uncharacterized protein n=1 Tax=Steinernema carpocapsae TaxID=34508 RepID=A0A4U8UR04_STECR|nr:hypothetical protein L596_002404 [Steinernema carpocapsae]
MDLNILPGFQTRRLQTVARRSRASFSGDGLMLRSRVVLRAAAACGDGGGCGVRRENSLPPLRAARSGRESGLPGRKLK